MTNVIMLIGAVLMFIVSVILVIFADPMYSLLTLLVFVTLLTALFVRVVER